MRSLTLATMSHCGHPAIRVDVVEFPLSSFQTPNHMILFISYSRYRVPLCSHHYHVASGHVTITFNYSTSGNYDDNKRLCVTTTLSTTSTNDKNGWCRGCIIHPRDVVNVSWAIDKSFFSYFLFILLTTFYRAVLYQQCCSGATSSMSTTARQWVSQFLLATDVALQESRIWRSLGQWTRKR